MKKAAAILAIVLTIFMTGGLAWANTGAIANGIAWLEANQNASGSWGNTPTSKTTEFLSTAAAIAALDATGLANSAAAAWLNSATADSTAYLAERINLLAPTLFDVSGDTANLISYRNDMAWGGYKDYDDSPLFTASALTALKGNPELDQLTLQKILTTIRATQNADGGWGFYSGDTSNTFVTAYMLSAINEYEIYMEVSSMASRAEGFILSQQNPDGGFGGGASTIYDTALSYMALINRYADVNVMKRALSYLETTQSADGSWDMDAYSTALAIQALGMVSKEGEPAPPPLVIEPQSGSIGGRVVDAETGQHLAGVQVSLAVDSTISIATDTGGAFVFDNLQPGEYGLNFSFEGYRTAYLIATLNGTERANIEDVQLSPFGIPGTIVNSGTIIGTIRDYVTGAPMSGVSVVVTGAHSATVQTIADGTYSISDITPGVLSISASLAGYEAISVPDVTIFAGETLDFSGKLRSVPPTEEEKTLGGAFTGTIYDAGNNEPVAGAKVYLDIGVSTTTASDGTFTFDGLEPGKEDYFYYVTVTGVGYENGGGTIFFSVCSNPDVKYYLARKVVVLNSTFIGVVRDEYDGSPIEGALVRIYGTESETLTGPDGSYMFEDVRWLEFNIKVSHNGYNSYMQRVQNPEHGDYRVDFSIGQSLVGKVKLGVFAAEKAEYLAYQDAYIRGTVQYTGEQQALVQVYGNVIDASDEVVSRILPMESGFLLGPASVAEVAFKWNTKQFPPDDYRIEVKVIESASVEYDTLSGAPLDKAEASVRILESLCINGGITVDPAFTRPELSEPVRVAATVRNTSNTVFSNENLSLVVTAESGQVVYSATRRITLSPNMLTEIDFGSFIPADSGKLFIALESDNPKVLLFVDNAEINVGSHAKGSFTINPEEAAAGDVKAMGLIHIDGAVSTGSTVQDPLVPIIKDAIQKGVMYQQEQVVAWHMDNGCNGCHVQSQALVGLEYSRNVVEVDNEVADLLANSFYVWSFDNWRTSPYGVRDEIIALSLWAMSSREDANESGPYVIRAADYLVNKQKTNGVFAEDAYRNNNHGLPNWFGGELSFTSLVAWGVQRAYEITGDNKYLSSLEKVANYFITTGHETIDINENLIRAQELRTAAMIGNVVNDNVLSDSLKTLITNDILILVANQNLDGSWSRSGDYAQFSDPLVTSHVLYSLLKAGVSPDENCIRQAVLYLLNTQDDDGAWQSGSDLYSTKYAATTWVVISLPYAYQKISGIDVDVLVDLPENVLLESADPSPISSVDGLYRWKLTSVNEIGRDISLDLTALELQKGEIRKVAERTAISFADIRTGRRSEVELETPLIKGLAPVSVNVQLDKSTYNANEEMDISVELKNLAPNISNAALDIAIEDMSGNVIANITDENVNDLEPVGLVGWNYRIPATIISSRPESDVLARTSIDFVSIFNSLGINNSLVDENSIRVLEHDSSGNMLGEKRIAVNFNSEMSCALTWLVDGSTEQGQSRNFYVYFDIRSNGPKPNIGNAVFEKSNQLIYLHYNNGSYVMTANGNGTFGIPERIYPRADWGYGTVFGDTQVLQMGDFNNDGYYDFVGHLTSYSGKTFYYQNKGHGTNAIEDGVLVAGTHNVSAYAAGDVNNDGNLDLIIGTRIGYSYVGLVYTYLGNGNGTFTLKQTFETNDLIKTDIQLIDMDSDGILDAIFNYSIYKGNGDGTFSESPKIICSGWNCDRLFAGDFDNDQMPDLILNYSTKNRFYRNKGEMIFEYVSQLSNVDIGRYNLPALGDFDGDGNLDMLAPKTSGFPYSNSGFSMLFAGKGDGTFADGRFVMSLGGNYYEATPQKTIFNPSIGKAELVPTRELIYNWNVSSTYAGNYIVHAKVHDSTGESNDAFAQFDILPDIALETTLAIDKASYTVNDTVKVVSTIASTGQNYILSAISAVFSISDAQGEYYSESTQLSNLLPNQMVDLKAYWDTGVSPAGTYIVRLDVIDATGAVLSTSEATFEIISSTAAGAGLAGLSGTISASPALVRKGDDETLAYSMRNDGNVDMDGLGVTVLIVNTLDMSLMHEEAFAISLPQGTSIVDSLSVSTSSFAAVKYLAILRAGTSGMAEPKTLASAVFEVEAPTVEASKNIGAIAGRSALVWINYKRNCKGAHSDKDAYPDVEAVRSAVRAAGFAVNIVYDKKAFQEELRSPFYTDYVILGDYHPIEGHFSDELREKVRRGSGLVSSLFNRHNLDNSAFGVKVRGSLSVDEYPLEMIESPVSGAAMLETTGRVLRINAFDESSVIGWVVEQKSEETHRREKKSHKDKKKEKSGKDGKDGKERRLKTRLYPAGVTGSYGIGNTVFFAVDIGLGLSSDPAFGQMLTEALNYIHTDMPAEGGTYPYAFVPVELTLENLGDAIDVRVSEWYPDGFRLYEPMSGTWAEESPWTFDLSLGAEETRVVPFFALTPDITGAHVLRSEIAYLEGGQYSHIQDVEVMISVEDTLAIRNRAESAIRALLVSSAEMAHVDDALAYLESAYNRPKDTEAGIQESINDVIHAIDSLLRITSADVTDAVMPLDTLLMSYEGMWYFLEKEQSPHSGKHDGDDSHHGHHGKDGEREHGICDGDGHGDDRHDDDRHDDDGHGDDGHDDD